MTAIFRLSPKPIFCILSILFCGFGASSITAQTHTSDLPILVIGIEEQDVPSEDKAFVTFKIASNDNGQPNSSDGPFNHYDGFVGIEERGSTSLAFPKHGYSIELRTAEDEDLDFPLLGMPEEEDWVLHGPYSDKTLLRNAFTYNLGQSSSTWAPRSRFCSVVFQDEYYGVFLLVERIKRDKNRLDIAKLTDEDTEGIELTGGYLLKIDKNSAEDPDIDFSFTLPIVDQDHNVATQLLYHVPKPDEIVEAQKTYIESWMENFEARLAGPDFTDEQFGYRALIDMDSWIDFFFINEITRNVDGYRISTYMHKRRDDAGGKLHMGPIWDFNLGLGNADYCDGGEISGWAYKFNDVCGSHSNLISFHYQRLLQDSLFSAHLVQRWEAFRANEWSDENLFGLYDSLAAEVQTSAPTNFARWPIIGDYIWPNNYVESDYEDGVRNTRSWLADRLEWLDMQIPFLAPGVSDLTEIEKSFYFGPKVPEGPLVLEGFQRSDYPIALDLFSASGQLLYKQKVSSKDDVISFEANGIVFYQLKTLRGNLLTGKLFVY